MDLTEQAVLKEIAVRLAALQLKMQKEIVKVLAALMKIALKRALDAVKVAIALALASIFLLVKGLIRVVTAPPRLVLAVTRLPSERRERRERNNQTMQNPRATTGQALPATIQTYQGSTVPAIGQPTQLFQHYSRSRSGPSLTDVITAASNAPTRSDIASPTTSSLAATLQGLEGERQAKLSFLTHMLQAIGLGRVRDGVRTLLYGIDARGRQAETLLMASALGPNMLNAATQSANKPMTRGAMSQQKQNGTTARVQVAELPFGDRDIPAAQNLPAPIRAPRSVTRLYTPAQGSKAEAARQRGKLVAPDRNHPRAALSPTQGQAQQSRSR